jgi:splicing factor 3B subunit 2
MTDGAVEDNDYDNPDNPFYELYQQMKPTMKRFSLAPAEPQPVDDEEQTEVFYEEDLVPEETTKKKPKLSKKQRKQMNRPTIAQLKMVSKNPESIQFWDRDAPDPFLYLHIKELKNIVPVPDHWSVKREYLSSKRGIEKPPFQLPKFIADTGITAMRAAQLEKEQDKTLKQKQRDRVQPKMGKLDIDYQKLYDAFFKYQTKPPLTRFGEVYYEGKELETKTMNFKPGVMSEALKEGLGMPVGAPLPWLLTMQKIGPPPAFPTMEIPGLNAPIPPGASWGYAPGQFGKPTLDEYNRPMWGGDVFGVYKDPQTYVNPADNIDKTLWGIVRTDMHEEEEEESEEEEEEEDEEMEMSPEPVQNRGPRAQFKDVSGEQLAPTTSRWNVNADAAEHSGSLYQVIGEQETRVEGFMGSTKRYDLQNPRAPIAVDDDLHPATKRKATKHDVSIDLEALERPRLDSEGFNKQHTVSDAREIRKQTEQMLKQYQDASNAWTEDDFNAVAEMIQGEREKNEESRKRQKL